jgi:hypothetical protein
MKAPVLIALTLSAAPFAVAAVDTGATLDEVRATLGTPNGQMRLGERQLLYYQRGSVELLNGRVTRVAMLSAEEHLVQAAREERLQAERATRRAQLIEEGTALRDRKLADAMFQSAPVAYQVSFWEDFARRYPDVSCAEPLMIARLKLNEQWEEKNRKTEELNRLAEIEQRLAAAEREPVYYRVRSYPSRYGHRDRHQEFALWPVSYTYYDAPLPAYTTPTTPLINPFRGDPAQPERRDYDRPGRDNWKHDKRYDRREHNGWRGNERGHSQRRDRM